MSRTTRVEMILTMLKNEPNDLFLNYSLGLEHFADKDFTKAEDCFKKALSIESDYIPAYYQLGKLFEAQNKTEDALAFYNKGLAFAKEQKNNKAINEFGEAIFMLED
jgi:uncharacterized protein HemY